MAAIIFVNGSIGRVIVMSVTRSGTSHPAQQVSVSGVGTHLGPEYVRWEIGHPTRTLLVTLFEPPEGLILVAEAGINHGDIIGIDVGVRRQVLEFPREPERISSPA
jgi:hypothetical protein